MLRVKRRSSLSTDLDGVGDLDCSPLPLSYASEGWFIVTTTLSTQRNG